MQAEGAFAAEAWEQQDLRLAGATLDLGVTKTKPEVLLASPDSVTSSAEVDLEHGHEKSSRSVSTSGKLAKQMCEMSTRFAAFSEEQQEYFTIVTDDVPLNHVAGLKNVSGRIWKKKKISTLLNTVFMIGQLGLNTYMAISSFHFATRMTLNNGMGVTVDQNGLKICSHRLPEELALQQSNSTRGKRCLQADSLPSALWRALLLVEGAAGLLLVFLVIFHALLLVTSKAKAPKRAARFYVWFIFMPDIACRFSLFMFLHYASLAKIAGIFFRNELRCCFAIMRGHASTSVRHSVHYIKHLKSIGGKLRVGSTSDDDSDNEEEGEEERDTRTRSISSAGTRPGGQEDQPTVDIISDAETRHMWCWDIFGLVLVISSIFLALHVLLMKLSLVYYAGLYYYSNWSLTEFWTFVGFVNQLGGLSMSRQVELLRTILFKFGGENSTWSATEIEACNAYFMFLAERIVQERDRFEGLAVLWSIDSDSLQQLFQGHARADMQAVVRPDTIRMFQSLHSKDALEALRDKLIASAKRAYSTLDAKIKGRLNITIGSGNRPSKSESFKSPLDTVNHCMRKACGQLHLAAKVQEFIWQWEKDRHGYDDFKTKNKSSKPMFSA